MMPTARSWRTVRAEALATGKLDEERLAEDTTRLLDDLSPHPHAERLERQRWRPHSDAHRLGTDGWLEERLPPA